MSKPQFSITTEEQTKTYGRFVIEPLPKGFGDTLGNSLRRVLYSSISGAAITSVKISGVNHQFTSLDGMREDIVQLILALKQVRLTYTSETPAKITLEASGPGQVTAGDIDTPPDVIIANPELVLAHLADKSTKLEFEATVESGLGYSPAEDRKSNVIGSIPVDATFSPVMRVNYKVEATRVGRVTDYDRLNLEVYTDGTVSPKDTITSASQTLVDYFGGILNPDTLDSIKNTPAAGSRPIAGATISVEELDLPTRISNALQKAGFATVADLISLAKPQLSKVKNLGGKSVDIIESALKERGFSLTQ
jgi:DNA-directed RNA polymerase subunit alpha